MKRTTTAVWHDKYKRWQINVQKDGERRSFYSSTQGRAGQRECNKKADVWLDAGLISPQTKVLIIYNEWIKELQDTTSTEHSIQYEGYGKNWICSRLGRYKIGELTEQQFQSVINNGFKKGLSKKTLSNIRGCINAFLKYARKCKATTLIAEDIKIPRNAKVGERVILQPNDLATLFKNDDTIIRGKPTYELYINAYRFAVVAGLRPGEIIGLKWSDIEDNKVSIKRSINRLKEETTGKNDNARRSFYLTPLAQDILNKQKLKLAELNIKSDYVFADKFGDVIIPSMYYKRWVRYRDYHEMSEASPYELRHTFVSVVKQLPKGLLKPLIGHSEDMDTYGTYSHEIDGDMELTAKLVQDVFSDLLK